MYWRILFGLFLLVGAAYFLGQSRRAAPESPPVAMAGLATAENFAPDEVGEEVETEDISYAPISLPPETFGPASATQAIPETRSAEEQPIFSLDLLREGQRIASATGTTLAEIVTTAELPSQSPMAMRYRQRGCMLAINAALPLDGYVLHHLSAYGQRQLTFTLAHEIGHCYMLTRVARRDPAFLPSLSPPGRSYDFDQYVTMMGRYSDYPDLNRWNEEWADTFAAFALNRVYGREFAASVTNERLTMRRQQEKHGSVLMSNIYGGHGSLAEEAVFTIQSPLEIANLVKLGRLNTSR